MKPLKPPSTPVDEREISLALGPAGRKLARLGYELLYVSDMTDAHRAVFAIVRMDPAAVDQDDDDESEADS